MTIAPHSGIVDFGVFTSPDAGKDGIQGEVPAPLITELGYVLTSNGWAAAGSIPPRVVSQASLSSPYSWNSSTADIIAVTALANNLTINADSSTPSNGAKVLFRIKDNGTPRVITFIGGVAKGFRPVGAVLTSSGSDFTYTTVANKVVYFGCIYNSDAVRWDIVALSQEA